MLNSQIGIWYTVWWDDSPPYDAHWTDWTRYKPVLGDYSANNVKVVRRHMEWIKKAGIDYVILDDTNGHMNDGGNIASNIDAIFEIVESMADGTAPQLSLAVGYHQWGANNVEAHQAEVDLIFERYVSSPVYYHWKGKPLLINYTTPSWFSRWDDERFTVRWATGRVSEGIHAAPESGLWGWVFDQEQSSDEVLGVMPGWNTAHLGRGTTPIPRKGGHLYANMWMEAVRKNPEMIVIASFNDHAEETGIEAVVPRQDPALAYTDQAGNPSPDWYQLITEGYACLKNGLREDFYYQEESDKKLYQVINGELERKQEADPLKPVIVLPKGFLKETDNR